MLKLCRLILFLTRFFAGTKFQLGGGGKLKSRGDKLEPGGSSYPPAP